MFRLFNRVHNGKESRKTPKLADIDGNVLREGDIVESLRYDLGRCRLIHNETGYYYESLESGEKVSWVKMVDARTEMQKVRKIIEEG